MNADEISNLCTHMIAPLNEKIEGLVNNLASKSDLQLFILDIESKFEHGIKSCFDHFNKELDSRDAKIKTLEVEIENLKLSSIQNATDFNNLTDRVENLENRQNDIYESSSVLSHHEDIDESDPENESDVDNESDSLDFLCLGDSLIKWLKIEEINPGSKNLKVCKPGATILDIRDELIELNEIHDIRNIYLTVGCNEIPHKSPVEVATELGNFLSEIRLHMPSTKVYLSAILPKSGDDYLPGINAINYLLCNICNSVGIVFVQHPSFASNGNINWSLYAHDGIHLNTRGVPQLCADIRRLASSFI